MKKSPKLGIAVTRSFSVCRLVNVDTKSDLRHSSLSVVVDELNGWTWEIALHFVNGRLHVVIPQSCRRRPSDPDDVRQVLSEMMDVAPEKMILICMERLGAAKLLEALLTEIDLYNPDKMEWVNEVVREEIRKCVLEPNL